MCGAINIAKLNAVAQSQPLSRLPFTDLELCKEKIMRVGWELVLVMHVVESFGPNLQIFVAL